MTDIWEKLSFLAAPHEVCDWRLALLFDVAAEEGLLDRLPATVLELSAQGGLDPRLVRILLEALNAWGVVSIDGEEFRTGPAAPDAAATAVLRHHGRALRHWVLHLPAAIRPSAPPPPVDASTRLENWLEALSVNARLSAPAAVDACLERRPGIRTVLDLGGGHGEYALEFASRGVEATMQDRPEVIDLVHKHGRLERAGVELTAADFFQALPPHRFDMVFCAGVTYTFDGARNRLLFERVRPSIQPDGMLAIHTFLRRSDPRSAFFAVQMAAGGPGDTHTAEDYRTWLAEAGYPTAEVIQLERPPEAMLFATPAAA